MEVNVRQLQLETISSFVNDISSKVESVLESLGWDVDHITNKPETKVCHINREHRVPKDNYHEHVEKCLWAKEGYSDDLPLSEPCHTDATIIINKELQEKIIKNAAATKRPFVLGSNRETRTVPKSAKRITSDLTVDERLAVYDYAVAHIEKDAQEPHSNDALLTRDLLSQIKAKDREKSLQEILAAERDLKRRRTRYKGVHTNKKNHLEILREVIANQMEMLAEQSSVDETATEQAPSVELESHRQIWEDNSSISSFRPDRRKVENWKDQRWVNRERNDQRRDSRYDNEKYYDRRRVPHESNSREIENRSFNFESDYSKYDRSNRSSVERPVDFDDRRSKRNSSDRNKFKRKSDRDGSRDRRKSKKLKKDRSPSKPPRTVEEIERELAHLSALADYERKVKEFERKQREARARYSDDKNSEYGHYSKNRFRRKRS